MPNSGRPHRTLYAHRPWSGATRMPEPMSTACMSRGSSRRPGAPTLRGSRESTQAQLRRGALPASFFGDASHGTTFHSLVWPCRRSAAPRGPGADSQGSLWTPRSRVFRPGRVHVVYTCPMPGGEFQHAVARDELSVAAQQRPLPVSDGVAPRNRRLYARAARDRRLSRRLGTTSPGSSPTST